MCVYICVYIHTHTQYIIILLKLSDIFLCVCMCVCVCVYVYIYIYIYIYIHTHTNKTLSSRQYAHSHLPTYVSGYINVDIDKYKLIFQVLRQPFFSAKLQFLLENFLAQ